MMLDLKQREASRKRGSQERVLNKKQIEAQKNLGSNKMVDVGRNHSMSSSDDEYLTQKIIGGRKQEMMSTIQYDPKPDCMYSVQG